MRSSSKYLTCSIAVVLSVLITFDQSVYALDVPTLAAAQVAAQPIHPPAQIATAHTVFLTNAGEDANFPIDSTESFNAIYASLRAWGHYRLVDSPDQAELVFQLHGVAPITGVSGTNGDVYSSTSPAFQLTILDPKTNVALWTITSPVDLAGRGNKRAHWISIAEENLVSRIKVLANQPLTPTETADLTTAPHHHIGRNLLIVGGAVAGLTVGLVFLERHHAKSTQDAFCQAHNIPLSMCAGG
ncbi:MAG TPA: hypothetical protein VGU46_14430 [Acidobacteriaceae bacterium]|nr:hypothetical protein [Acidobacteriaceae bacterium]